MHNQLLGFFFHVGLCFNLAAAIEDPHVVRAAIDIGMGGPKLQVAEVDPQTHKIVKVLHTERYYVNFYEGISQNGDSQFSPEMRAQGVKAVKQAVDKANSFGADRIVAIATASFRAAVNGDKLADEIQNATGIQVHIVDQDLEGKLAFQAALSKLNNATEHLVVWDIGGGSVQFIRVMSDGTYLVDGQETGVGAFKDYIIENIQHRNTKEITSPNPMSVEDIAPSISYARCLSNEIDQDLKEKISHPTTTVVGVGSVFGYGIRGVLGGKTQFSIDDLAAFVQSLPGKTDVDLGGGDYAHVEGSNAIFVLGFMQNLKIDKMHLINVNNADGALIYEPFGKEQSVNKQNTCLGTNSNGPTRFSYTI